MRFNRYNVPVPLRCRLITAVLACLVFVVLPLGGGALGATSSGADGDIVFVRGTGIFLKSTGTQLIASASDPSWSPNGTMLAYVDSGGIKSCTVSGGSCGTVVSSGVAGTQPAWSPSTTTPKLAYVLTSSGQIHVMSPSGT